MMMKIKQLEQKGGYILLREGVERGRTEAQRVFKEKKRD